MMATMFPDDCSNMQIHASLSGTTSRVQKNAESKGKEYVMKKGRAIQVEDGDGERIPSADIRRPRAQHSDVVIQIATEGLGELVSVPDIKDEGHLNEHGCAASIRQESMCLFYKGRLSQDHDMQVFGGRTPVSANKDALEEAKHSLQSKTGDKVCDSRSDGSEAESASHEHIQLGLSNTDSHSEDSIGVRSVEYPHDTFCCSTFVVEEHSDDDDVDRNERSRGISEVRDASERSASFDDDFRNSYPYRKYWKEEDMKEFRCSRKSKHMTVSYDGVGDKSTSKKWNTEKWASRDDSHHFSTKDVLEGNYSGGELEEKEYWLRERASIRSSDKIEKYRDRTGCVYTTRDVARERSNLLMSEHRYFEKRRDSYIQHMREDFHVNVDDIYNGRSARDRYKEEFDQEVHGRGITCRSRDLDIYDFGVSRYPVGESRNLDAREKYDYDPCFALDKRSKIAEYDAKSWRHLDGRRSGNDAYKENRVCYDKEWCNVGYSENNLHRRASKRHDQSKCRGSLRTSEFRDGYCVSNKEYHHDPYSRNTHEFESDRFSGEEFVSFKRSCNHKRKFSLLDRERVFVDDNVNSSHKDRSNQSSLLGLSFNKKSSSHGKAFIKCDRSGGHVYPSFHDDINKLSGEEVVHFVSKDNSASISGKFKKDARETVDMNFNGWKSEFHRRRHKLKSEGYSGPEKGLTKRKRALMIDDELYTKNEILVNKLKVGAVEASNYFEKEWRREGKLDPLGNALKINGDSRQQNPGNHEDGELEEGELIEEPPSSLQEIIPDKRMRKAGRKTSQTIQSRGSNGLDEKNVQSEHSALPCKLAGKYDDSHILEALAKMQKRKERFDNSITPKADPKRDLSLQIVDAVGVDEAKHQRPARKRRWGGS